MSNVKANESRPFMDKLVQNPVSPSDPGRRPPPYSSLFNTQSQEYTPLPSASVETPHSVQTSYPIQMPKDTTPNYDPMSHAIPGVWKPIIQPPYNPTYAPTTYDPMANVPPVNHDAIPNEAIIVSSQSANSSRKAKRCRYMKVCSGISIILVIIMVVVRGVANTTVRTSKPNIRLNLNEGQYGHISSFEGLHLPKNNLVWEYNNHDKFGKETDEFDKMMQKLSGYKEHSNRVNSAFLRSRRDVGRTIPFGEKKVKLYAKKKCIRKSNRS